MIAEVIGDLIASFVGGWTADGFIARKRGKAAQQGIFMSGCALCPGVSLASVARRRVGHSFGSAVHEHGGRSHRGDSL